MNHIFGRRSIKLRFISYWNRKYGMKKLPTKGKASDWTSLGAFL
jgi:hypothetical protein